MRPGRETAGVYQVGVGEKKLEQNKRSVDCGEYRMAGVEVVWWSSISRVALFLLAPALSSIRVRAMAHRMPAQAFRSSSHFILKAAAI